MTTIQTATKDKAPLPSRENGHAASRPSQPPPLSAEASAKADALPLDLSTVSDFSLSALLPAIEQEMAKRHAKKEADLLAHIREQAAVLGITPARLAAALANKAAPRPRANGGTDGRSIVKPKYWCLTDHALRWSGRGAQPKWYADHLAAGGKPEDMLIPEGAA